VCFCNYCQDPHKKKHSAIGTHIKEISAKKTAYENYTPLSGLFISDLTEISLLGRSSSECAMFVIIIHHFFCKRSSG